MKRCVFLPALILVVFLPAAAGAVVLWDQSAAAGPPGILSQDYEPAIDGQDIYGADDFTNTEPWEIQSIFTRQEAGADAFSCAASLNWMIFGDGGNAPNGDPSGVGFAPEWSLSLSPSDPAVTINGDMLTVKIDPADRVVLPPGTWWLVFFPERNAPTCGEYSWLRSTTMNGAVATQVNPSGSRGFGTFWFPITDHDITYHDIVFRLEGEVSPCPAVFDFASGGLTIPEVDIIGLAKSYTVNMIRTSDPGYFFELTLARRVELGCDSATYNPATGILVIHRLDIMGTPKSYVVRLARQPGPWYYFEVISVEK